MIVADFHVHSTFSVDGMSTMEQHCIMAMQKGIKKICFLFRLFLFHMMRHL